VQLAFDCDCDLPAASRLIDRECVVAEIGQDVLVDFKALEDSGLSTVIRVSSQNQQLRVCWQSESRLPEFIEQADKAVRIPAGRILDFKADLNGVVLDDPEGTMTRVFNWLLKKRYDQKLKTLTAKRSQGRRVEFKSEEWTPQFEDAFRRTDNWDMRITLDVGRSGKWVEFRSEVGRSPWRVLKILDREAAADALSARMELRN